LANDAQVAASGTPHLSGASHETTRSKSKFGQNEDSFLRDVCFGLCSSSLSGFVMPGSRRIGMALRKTPLHTVVDQDGAAILDIERGLITTLNPTGAYVWQGLQHGETLEKIAANLSRETGEDSLVVDRDVHQFFEDLEENHLFYQ
jgi:hypothetical protein